MILNKFISIYQKKIGELNYTVDHFVLDTPYNLSSEPTSIAFHTDINIIISKTKSFSFTISPNTLTTTVRVSTNDIDFYNQRINNLFIISKYTAYKT